MSSCRLTVAAIAALLAVAPAAAQTVPPDPAQGRTIATTWCVGCHVIDREGRLGNDAGPPFTGLAGDPARTESTLRAFLTEPHDPMPALSLSREEIEHLIAYIRSLAG